MSVFLLVIAMFLTANADSGKSCSDERASKALETSGLSRENFRLLTTEDQCDSEEFCFIVVTDQP